MPTDCDSTIFCNWTQSDIDLENRIQTTVQILVTVVSGLSLICNIGIFSCYYFLGFKYAKKKAHSRGRLIAISITCISLADFISGVSHIQGVWTSYGNTTHQPRMVCAEDMQQQNTGCGAQAMLSVFGTLASFLWIDVLVIVVMTDSRAKKCLKVFGSQAMVVITHVVCWGLPLFTAVGLASANVLGFEEGIDIGWCYIDTTGYSTAPTILIFFFGRQLWALLTIACLILGPLCSCVYNCCYGIMAANNDGDGRERQALQEPEVVVYFNPCCCSRIINWKASIYFQYVTLGIILACGFMFLRLPNIIIDWFITYDENYRCTKWYLGGLVLAAFGDSAIGLFNCIWIVMCKMSFRRIQQGDVPPPPRNPVVAD